jgi:FlaA1/EpsC-like NDP-sugar epimerase
LPTEALVRVDAVGEARLTDLDRPVPGDVELSRTPRGQGELLQKMLSALDRPRRPRTLSIVPVGTLNSREEITVSRTAHEGPMAGKVALVTGGSRGIGAAIAKRSTRAGMSRPH